MSVSYEDALKELNKIIEKVESGKASLSETVEFLERGKELVEVCYKELDTARGKLTEIKEALNKLEEE